MTKGKGCAVREEAEENAEDSSFEYRGIYFYLTEDHPTGIPNAGHFHQNLYEQFLQTRICMNISTDNIVSYNRKQKKY